MKLNRKALIILPVLLGIAAFIKFVVLRPEFLYLGTIEATQVDISPRVASVIHSLEVKEGQKVEKEQLLLTLAGEDLKLYAETAESDFVRAQKLLKNGSISQEAFDHLRFKRDETSMKYAWTQIHAPMNGTVLNSYREVGEWVSPGVKLLTLANLDEVWVVVYVPQPMLAKISLGLKVDGIMPEFKQRTFSGKIVRISDEAEFTPKNVQTRAERTRLVFGIKVAFDNREGLLKPGMSLEVRLPE